MLPEFVANDNIQLQFRICLCKETVAFLLCTFYYLGNYHKLCHLVCKLYLHEEHEQIIYDEFDKNPWEIMCILTNKFRILYESNGA